MCSLFKDIICNTFPLLHGVMKFLTRTACPFSTTLGNIYQGFESSHKTTIPCATHIQNKVPNKVHR